MQAKTVVDGPRPVAILPVGQLGNEVLLVERVQAVEEPGPVRQDRAGESVAGPPVPEAESFLNVDAGNEVRKPLSEPIVSGPGVEHHRTAGPLSQRRRVSPGKQVKGPDRLRAQRHLKSSRGGIRHAESVQHPVGFLLGAPVEVQASQRVSENTGQDGRDALDALLGRSRHGDGVDLLLLQRLGLGRLLRRELPDGVDVDRRSGGLGIDQIDTDDVGSGDKVNGPAADREELCVSHIEGVSPDLLQAERESAALVRLGTHPRIRDALKLENDGGSRDRDSVAIRHGAADKHLPEQMGRRGGEQSKQSRPSKESAETCREAIRSVHLKHSCPIPDRHRELSVRPWRAVIVPRSATPRDHLRLPKSNLASSACNVPAPRGAAVAGRECGIPGGPPGDALDANAAPTLTRPNRWRRLRRHRRPGPTRRRCAHQALGPIRLPRQWPIPNVLRPAARSRRLTGPAGGIRPPLVAGSSQSRRSLGWTAAPRA